MNVARSNPTRDKLLWTAAGVVLVIVIALVDSLVGTHLTIPLFYLVPISMVAWFAGGRLGLVISTASSIAWFMTDFSISNNYNNIVTLVWNTILQLVFFIVVTALFSTLRKAFNVNQQLARNDYVTGAATQRYFYELAQTEISRAKRNGRVFSLAYIDLDNFKQVNDQFGHSAGDKVLQAVARCILTQTRLPDIFARLGGDEFALLLVETGEVAVQSVVVRLHEKLQREMQKNNWPVTFSIGVVTFVQPPTSVDEMVKQADDAMYVIKNSTKNGIVYQVNPPGSKP
jgi:diguanylate cyclase (GGDEF)-like protein